MENNVTKKDFHVSFNWDLGEFKLQDFLVLQTSNATKNPHESSNGINKSKVTLKPPKDFTEPLIISIESLNRSLLIESVDFVCSGSCIETYASSNGYLNTSKGVLLGNDLQYPPKTFLILNSFEEPLNKLQAKFPLDKELHLYNIFITPSVTAPSPQLTLADAKRLLQSMSLSENACNGLMLSENNDEEKSEEREGFRSRSDDHGDRGGVCLQSMLDTVETELKKHLDASVARLESKVMTKLNEIEQLIKKGK